MLNFSEFYLIKEAFDTVSDFMINPDNSKKDYGEIMQEFEKSGGKLIGYGSFGVVYFHPKWPYILKIFKSDDAYLKYARFAYDNPHPSFPKFYGKPQRVIPSRYTYEKKMDSKRYLVRIEKLNPISDKIFDKIDLNLVEYFQIKNGKIDGKNKNIFEMENKIKNLPKEIYNLLEGLYIIKSKFPDIRTDLHDENVMIRNDGQYVLTDPLSDRMMGDDEDAPSLMMPETFHLLHRHVNNINSKLKNAELEIETLEGGMYDLNLTLSFDISKCGFNDVEIFSDYENEIGEYFADGGDLYFEFIRLDASPKILELNLKITNMGTMNNIKDGIAYADMVPEYIEWVNREIQPNICEILHELMGEDA